MIEFKTGKDRWATQLQDGIGGMLAHIVEKDGVALSHVIGSPQRYTKALAELFSGVGEDPKSALNTLFPTVDYDEMVHIKEITFFSMCAHHLVPFFGKMSFAYIPDKQVVGLSKIPRLVEVYARRPQVQEELTVQIVNAFQDIVAPKGCALMVRAYHMCCMSRGIKQPTCYTETTALRGIFRDTATKEEFLSSANASNWKVF